MRVFPSLATFVSAVLLLAMGCGAAASVPAPEPSDDRPRLDGELVWDLPLEEATDDVRLIWETAERVLAEPGPESPPDLSLDDYTTWMHANWSPWLEARVAALQDLRERFSALAETGGGRGRIFAAVVAGYIYDDFAKRIEAMPVPIEVQGDADLTSAFAEQLRVQAEPAWRRARESFGQCVEWAPGAPPALAGWGDACAQRLRELPEAAVAVPRPIASIAWPTECETRPEGTRPGVVELESAGPRPMALLSADSGPLTQGEFDRVADALHAHLRRTHRGLRLLPMREVRAARAHVAERRVSRRRSCARAPGIVTLLLARHPRLVTGSVAAECDQEQDGGRVCSLSFVHPAWPGAADFSLGAVLDGDPLDVDAWLAAVPELAERSEASRLFSVLGRATVRGAARLLLVEPLGAWGDASPAEALGRAAVALGACRDVGSAPASEFSALLAVAPDGGVTDIDIPLREGDRARIECVTHVFEDLELPPGEGPRRLTMRVAFNPDHQSTLPYRAIETRLHDAALEVNNALADPFLRAAVAECYAGNPDAHGAVTSHRVALTIDGSGVVTGVTLEGMTTPLGDDEDLDACITGALRTARFSCTPDGAEAEVEATLCVGGR